MANNEGTALATIAIIVSVLALLAVGAMFVFYQSQQSTDLSGVEGDIALVSSNLNLKTSSLTSSINSLDNRIDWLEDEIDDYNYCSCDIDDDDFDDLEDDVSANQDMIDEIIQCAVDNPSDNTLFKYCIKDLD